MMSQLGQFDSGRYTGQCLHVPWDYRSAIELSIAFGKFDGVSWTKAAEGHRGELKRGRLRNYGETSI